MAEKATTKGSPMHTLDRIVPILARTVMTVGVLTGIGSVAVAFLVGAPQLVLFSVIAFTAAAYGHQVASRESSPGTEAATATVHPLAA